MASTQLHIVILAAGKGKRMHSETPKALHCIAGKPILGHVLRTARRLNPSKIHVVVGHKKEQIMAAYNQADINYVEQIEQNGTGDAVRQALPQIPDSANVLVMVGDVPLIEYETLSSLVEANNNFPLALLTGVVENPFGLGRITRDASHMVCGIVEQKDAKPSQLEINEINSGFISAQAGLLRKWLSKVGCKNAQNEVYLTDVVALAYQDGCPVQAVHPKHNREIIGINSRAELAKVERLFQQSQAESLMNNGVTLIDPQRIDVRGKVSVGTDTCIDINCILEGPDTKIGSHVSIAANCIIINSVIGDGCHIHANTVIENAVLGNDVNVGPFARLRPGTELADTVRVGNFVETKNAKLGVGSKANHLSYIGDAAVGAKTNIGAGVITCNYDGVNKFKTNIGNDVFIGSNSQLIAPVNIADGATVGAGSTINQDVKANQLAISRGRQRQIDDWQRPKKNQ
jgi:bifunctional UDP-N-acetylglucosamine pyrophosphorylase/glucosamine-1-phosphate N-acetyltransferase